MSVQALKVEDEQPDGVIVVHRNFDGEHVLEGTSCWCRPEVITADSGVDTAEIVANLEGCDG